MSIKISLSAKPPENPLSELGEIEIFDTQSVTPSDFNIGLIARFDSIQVSSSDWAYSVTATLRRAYVQLRTVRCKVAQEGRSGDAMRPFSREIDKSVQISDEMERSTAASIGTGIELSAAGLKNTNLSAKGTKDYTSQQKLSVTSKSKNKEIDSSIVALPGERWVIKDLYRKNLYSRYSPEDNFCKIIAEGERGSVTGTLYFYPKDLSLEADDSGSLKSRLLKAKPNNVAVAKILMAKHLKSLNEPSDDTLISGAKIKLGKSALSFQVLKNE